VEGQDAANALDMGGSSCGFDAPAAARPRLSRARRKWPIARRRCSLRGAWRGTSRRPSSCQPLRRTMRSSRWRNRARPAPLAPGLMPLALMGDSGTRLNVSPSSTPHTHNSPTYHFTCRDCTKTCGWSGGEKRYASSALGSDEAGDDDMDKATRAAIARAYEFDRGTGGGEGGAR
jgi:hypothetical protein